MILTAVMFLASFSQAAIMCPGGSFLSSSGQCRVCSSCSEESFVVQPCSATQDTVCFSVRKPGQTIQTRRVTNTTDIPEKLLKDYPMCSDNKVRVTNQNGSYCCTQCDLGFHTKRNCDANNDTVCEPCEAGVNFSDVSHYQKECKTCSTCGPNSRLLKPCTPTTDTVCVCDSGFYRHQDTGKCLPCSACSPGWGAMRTCSNIDNTVCKACPNGTYSDIMSATNGCMICSTCRDEQVMLQKCSPVRDTVCLTSALYAKYKNIKGYSSSPIDVDSLNAASPVRTGHRVTRDVDVIPIYCSMLGLVVVGLFVYVVIKHTRRVRSQRDKCRHHEDAEYGHQQTNDSGVFIEQQTEPLTGKSRYCQVSLARRKEIASKLHKASKNGGDWKKLAQNLGYDKERISKFTALAQSYNSNAAELLLDEWSRHENSTISKLSKALHKTNRQEVAKLLLYAQCVMTELRPLKSTIVL